MWLTILHIWLVGLLPCFFVFLVTSGFELWTAMWAAAIWPILGAIYCGMYAWVTIKGPAKATEVYLYDDQMTITLTTGKRFTVPVHWASISKATPEQLADWKLVDGGTGIRWPQLDREVSVEYLLDQAEYQKRQK